LAIKAQLAMAKVTVKLTKAETEARIRGARAALKAVVQDREGSARRLLTLQ